MDRKDIPKFLGGDDHTCDFVNENGPWVEHMPTSRGPWME
jgi:hypothetical protein